MAKTGEHLFRLSPEYTKVSLKSLAGFYKTYHLETAATSKELAKQALENLLQGLSIEGGEFPNPDLLYFWERLELVTNNYYLASPGEKNAFKLGKVGGNNQRPTKMTYLDKSAIDQMKLQLLKEYPFLNRGDMEHNINSYCTISIKINKLLSMDVSAGLDKNNASLKNLIEAQIKLGDFLGIDESARQKMKQNEGKGDIGSLAEQFEDMIEEYPMLMKRFKFQELRLLTKKYERKELTRQLFELSSYADMSLEDAYTFINEHKAEYE